jgi:hypothetical protein
MRNRFDGFFERIFILVLAFLIFTACVMMCWMFYTSVIHLFHGGR